jgi:hypothetical protein
MQDLVKLIKQQNLGSINSQTDISKIKTAKLVGSNIIFLEMQNGSTRILRFEGDKISIYGTREILSNWVFDAFKPIFREARINSIMEEL